jgi:hypothetical protein
MDTGQRIVTRTPLTELWNSKGLLDASRAVMAVRAADRRNRKSKLTQRFQDRGVGAHKKAVRRVGYARRRSSSGHTSANSRSQP